MRSPSDWFIFNIAAAVLLNIIRVNGRLSIELDIFCSF